MITTLLRRLRPQYNLLTSSMKLQFATRLKLVGTLTSPSRKALNKAFRKYHRSFSFFGFSKLLVSALNRTFKIVPRRKLDLNITKMWTVIGNLLAWKPLIGIILLKWLKTAVQRSWAYGEVLTPKEVYASIYRILKGHARRISIHRLSITLQYLIEQARGPTSISRYYRHSRIIRAILALNYLEVQQQYVRTGTIEDPSQATQSTLERVGLELRQVAIRYSNQLDIGRILSQAVWFNLQSIAKAVALPSTLIEILRQSLVRVMGQHVVAGILWLNNEKVWSYLNILRPLIRAELFEIYTYYRNIIHNTEQLAIVLNVSIRQAIEIVGAIQAEIFEGGFGGRIATFSDGTGKSRLIAILNPILQGLLLPLHNTSMEILRTLPNDYTFDQRRIISTYQLWYQEGIRSLYSFDLSAATDRIPAAILPNLLFGDSQIINSYIRLMIGEAYTLSSFTENSQNSRELLRLTYGAGQGMGAYGRWSFGLALFHHMLLERIARSLGIQSLNAWAILGDDILIRNTAIAERYQAIITRLGVKINITKSIVPHKFNTERGLTPSYALEFAKLLFGNGHLLHTTSIGLGNTTSVRRALIRQLRNRPEVFRSGREFMRLFTFLWLITYRQEIRIEAYANIRHFNLSESYHNFVITIEDSLELREIMFGTITNAIEQTHARIHNFNIDEFTSQFNYIPYMVGIINENLLRRLRTLRQDLTAVQYRSNLIGTVPTLADIGLDLLSERINRTRLRVVTRSPYLARTSQLALRRYLATYGMMSARSFRHVSRQIFYRLGILYPGTRPQEILNNNHV